MEEEKDSRTNFIEHLLKKVAPQDVMQVDRQARSELRGILRGTSADYYRAAKHIAPFLGQKESEDDQWFYLVAGLLASHPKHDKDTPFATALGRLRGDSGSIDNRFLSLLNTPSESLASPLRQLVSLLEREGYALNYSRLLRDLSHWNHDDNWVQKQWARDFFRSAEKPEKLAEAS